jgi:hypothetical protein
MENFMALQEYIVYLTEPKLDNDFCKLTSINEPIASTITRANSNTVDGEQLWDVLANQKEFWKARCCNATIWAFFTPNSYFSLEVSSSTPQFEQLKCVLCILVVSVGLKKGIITYKTKNGISSL